MVIPAKSKERQLDVLFIEPNSSKESYQELANHYAAIEPSTWSLLLAQSCRSKGFGVAILDANAERLDEAKASNRINDLNPRLVCFVCYGQQPNSGTQQMSGAIKLCDKLKELYPAYKTCFVGSHSSALPKEVLVYDSIDFVLYNEGVYALHDLLKTNLKTDLHKVGGIGWKENNIGILNGNTKIVPQNMMDHDLPGYAWDLLPYKNKPFDLYKAHFWHAEFNENYKTPFAALYTSLGCIKKCSFCMINILNRTNLDDNISAANSPLMRFWSPSFIIKEFDKLMDYGVRTIRISDELFFLNRRYFEPLLNLIVERGYGNEMRSWSYSRIDTIKVRFLDLFKRAGIKWLATGIEAASTLVRREIDKGSFEDIDIRQAIKEISNAGIYNIGNYIFGFPDDNLQTMQQTLDLACELNTEMANFYSCEALPGSPLYIQAKQEGWKLPNSFEGYAFLSYETLPLNTKYCSAEEVLKFRDNAWQTYFTRPIYLNMIEQKFGIQQRKNIENLSKIKLKRKILGD